MNFLYTGAEPSLDDQGRIRIDDLEMKDDVQARVNEVWNALYDTNLEQYCDLDGYRKDFLKLHGFAVESINYEEDVDTV